MNTGDWSKPERGRMTGLTTESGEKRESRQRKNGEVTYPQSRWLRFASKKNRSTVALALAWRGPVLLPPSVCFRLSSSLCLCDQTETSILETGGKEREVLVVCLSPPHHGAPETNRASKESSRPHTHKSSWLYIPLKSPLSPSQTDR